jgi:hypothetical protein
MINKRARKAPKPYEPSSFRPTSKSSKQRRPGSKSSNGSSKSRTRKVQYRDDSDSDLFSDDDDVDTDDRYVLLNPLAIYRIKKKYGDTNSPVSL